MPATTWSTTDRVNVTTDFADLRATATGQGGVRAAVSASTGKYYWEIVANQWSSGNQGLGIANASAALSTMGPTPTNACIVYNSGAIWLNNANTGRLITFPFGSTGSPVGIALDLNAYQIWFRTLPSGNWNGTAGNDPATGVGGISIASIASSSVPVFPACSVGSSGNRITANFGAVPFLGVAPSGYTAGFPTSTTYTTADTVWSGTDLAGGASRGAGTLSVYFTGGGGGIRSVNAKSSGQYYFEYSQWWTDAATGIGIASGAANLTTAGNSASLAVLMYGNGPIYINGSYSGTSITNAPGDLIGVAVDLNNRRIWFRNGLAGNWNGSGTANPATNTGGLDISAVFPGPPFFIYAAAAVTTGAAGGCIFANFGDTPFLATAPSGFVAFDASGTGTSSALATQVGTEQWLTTDPLAQITQVAVEQWIVPSAQLNITQVALEHWAKLNPDLQVTQVALEHWASLAGTYPTPATPTLVLSASRAGIGSVVLVQDNATRTVMLADVGAITQIEQAVTLPPTGTAAQRAMILA